MTGTRVVMEVPGPTPNALEGKSADKAFRVHSAEAPLPSHGMSAPSPSRRGPHSAASVRGYGSLCKPERHRIDAKPHYPKRANSERLAPTRVLPDESYESLHSHVASHMTEPRATFMECQPCLSKFRERAPQTRQQRLPVDIGEQHTKKVQGHDTRRSREDLHATTMLEKAL